MPQNIVNLRRNCYVTCILKQLRMLARVRDERLIARTTIRSSKMSGDIIVSHKNKQL